VTLLTVKVFEVIRQTILSYGLRTSYFHLKLGTPISVPNCIVKFKRSNVRARVMGIDRNTFNIVASNIQNDSDTITATGDICIAECPSS